MSVFRPTLARCLANFHLCSICFGNVLYGLVSIQPVFPTISVFAFGILMGLFHKIVFSPTRLALGVRTFPDELVAGARPPRFRGEGAERRCSAPKVPQGSTMVFLRISLRKVPQGSAKVPQGSA